MQISNIKLQVNVNEQGGVSGRNVIYDIQNLDGSVDRISRVWHVYHTAPEYRDLFGGYIIERATRQQLNILKTYIIFCEKNIKNKKFPNVNVHLCGALLTKTRIKSAPKSAVKPRISATLSLTPQQIAATIHGLQVQINKLSATVALLNKQLAAEKKDKERIGKELDRTKTQLTTITPAMQILLKRD